MKRTINVCGIGHKIGKKKSNNQPYDFFVVSGTYVDEDYFDGVACCEFAVDNNMIFDVTVGKPHHVFFHYYNGKTYVDAIVPA